MHLLSQKRLRIRPSTIAGAGKGLFAFDRTAAPDAVLWKRLHPIIEYDGELINDGLLHQRYGDYTAPYAIRNVRDEDLQDPFARRVEDGACRRGVGALANHKPAREGANAFFYAQLHPNRIILKASRNIRNGDEIFVDYGEGYGFQENTRYSTRAARAF
jgi:SET domain-containing protein